MPPDDRVDAALAWVESPFQLLGALEAFRVGRLGERLAVLPRRGLASLVATAEEVTRLGLPRGVEILPPGRLPRRPQGTLALGDAFSGEVQRLLLTASPGRLVLLDDGRATRRLAQALGGVGTPLLRAHVPGTAARTVLGTLALRRMRGLARAGRLELVTALELGPELLAAVRAGGLPVTRHHFPWLRALPAEPEPLADTIVLGSSLVANNLIAGEPYLAWIEALASMGPLQYYAHRREDARTLTALSRMRGVQLLRGGVPVELRLRGLTTQRVFTLPTTAASTLRMIAPRAVIQERVVPPEWWRPEVPLQARRLLVPDTVPALPVPSDEVPGRGSTPSAGISI